MESEKQQTAVDTASRRKFVTRLGLVSAFATLASFGTWSLFNKREAKPTGKPKTVKMLTEDGRLVEIDESLLTAKRTRATNTDLQHWIKK